jgi:sugar/nucleoside kinase (ribokinase family)
LTATALVAAARLGAKCAFAGTLGYDEGSDFVLETFQREGVDMRHAVRQKGAGPVRSVIVVDEKARTRNIFADISAVKGAHPTQPSRAVIESSRVLFLDYFGMAGNIRAARLARRAGVAVVSDLERTQLPRMKALVELIDHPIFSHRAATEWTGEPEPAAAVEKIWSDARETVIVTCGEQGLWFHSREQGVARHAPAFAVDALDTTGCGDVFHGAYAAAVAFGMDVWDRIRFASAAAALKATKHGGQAGIPSRKMVKQFLSSQVKRRPDIKH